MENKWLKRVGYGSGDFACNLVLALWPPTLCSSIPTVWALRQQ